MASEKIKYDGIILYMILFDIKQNDVSRETFKITIILITYILNR